MDSDDLIVVSDDDVSGITRPTRKIASVKTKKKSNWISVAFDDFTPTTSVSTKQSVKSHPERKKCKTEISSSSQSFSQKPLKQVDLWVDKHQPNSKNDLVVHKKKIEEVENWIKINISQRGGLLLLTGPAGTGKTATIKVLVKQFNLDLQEWTNPITTTQASSRLFNDFHDGNFLQQESQQSQFNNFLLRANKYQCLQMSEVETKGKVILVEEFPNIFFKDISLFHNILRQYVRQRQTPLIFIVSDSSGSNTNERLLFPKDLQAELNIHNISFNPVATTQMTKALQKIAKDENSKDRCKFHLPSKEVIEELVLGSCGDIRGAINSLQFSCLQGLPIGMKPGKGRPASSSKTRSTVSSKARSRKNKATSKLSSEGAPIGCKDTTLLLFRALGKILYCKRDDPALHPDKPQLPAHLQHLDRDPLQFSPEDVVSRTQMSGDLFVSFLHQNYIDFLTELDDVVNASLYFSDADFLTNNWAHRNELREYSSSVATRGLLFSNSSRAKSTSSNSSGLGWKPLHKPMWLSTKKKIEDNLLSARAYFKGHWWTPVELMTQQVPYMSLIRITANQEQQRFLQEVGRFPKTKSQQRFGERLDEKDIVMMQDEESQDRMSMNMCSGEGQSVCASDKLEMTEAADDIPDIDEFSDDDW